MRLALYCDAPTWAQCHFARDLARVAERWGWSAMVAAGCDPLCEGGLFYSPCAGAAERIAAIGKPLRASGGLWSHVSYGGWFTDSPLDPGRLPRSPTHATNLYLHALTGLPYLPSGIDTDRFTPAVGVDGRRERHQRDRRLVVGFTASLQFNAAVKLFLDLWMPAVRRAGADGPLRSQRICARPLPVWDCRDARSPDEVAEYLRGIDVYLCSSISEGCSLSVLEAASAGCVVVSTPCGNAPELTFDDRQIVPWSVAAIAAALTWLDQDREAFYRLSEQTRQTVVDHWSWRSERKQEAWMRWLVGDAPLAMRDQVPYVATPPARLLDASRTLRLASAHPLVAGDMYGS